ncbi:MAG: hypothetical protein ACK4IZ_03205 [Flavobacterium sp.]|uniref:hypothetical protein n=1 Tax=Flavobacterium sp. TaxID=239 RepID=UPI00391A8742
MKKAIEFLKKTYWHWLAFVFTYAITWYGNTQNFMSLKTAFVEQIAGTQYGTQLAICTGGSFFVGFCIEIVQGMAGANKTQFEWRTQAIPDIVVTTGAGFLGSLFAITVYLNS